MTILQHTEGTISRADYLKPFVGTAAEAAHSHAADLGVTLAMLRQTQFMARRTIGNRKSYEAAKQTHAHHFGA